MKSALCAMTLRSVVNESLPLGGNGAKVSRARAGSALVTAPRIHSSISGLTSAAMTSIPKCRARAAHPPPMTPVPRSPSVFTFRMIASPATRSCNCHDCNIKNGATAVPGRNWAGRKMQCTVPECAAALIGAALRVISTAMHSPSRRNLLQMIGVTAGGAAMYQAMSSLGLAADSPYQGPIDLQGAPRGASVLILGAGLAGMSAAYELRNAGYHVQVLEFNARPGGRNWTLRGGDKYTELGGLAQECRFDKDLYINPGPWRIPYHHRGMLDYCKQLGAP